MNRPAFLAPLGIFFVGALGSWSPDAQAALVPSERLSSISVLAYECGLACYEGLVSPSTVSDVKQTTDFNEFDESLTLPYAGTSATQHSALDEYSLQVFSSASAAAANSTFGYHESLSEFTLAFSIDDPVSFTLTGNLALSGLANSASASARLTGAGIDIEKSLSGYGGPIDGALAIYEIGLLPPGSYTLSVLSSDRSSSFEGSGTATAGVDLMLAPVPLPMSALLLSFGLAMLGAFRLRTSCAATATTSYG